MAGLDLLEPDWDAPARVRAFSTTRRGGYSRGAWQRLNLATHVGDDAALVQRNRELLQRELGLPGAPQWLQQVHGAHVRLPAAPVACADACFEDRSDRVCVVMTADCLPVLFCNNAGSRVAAAHAGWRGLLAGVLEQVVGCFADRPEELMAWLGPAIGPGHFEVGDEVRVAFVDADPDSAACFLAGRPGHWLADIYALARLRLHKTGLRRVSGGGFCTFSDAARFFSYRREGISGRMATLIWLRD